MKRSLKSSDSNPEDNFTDLRIHCRSEENDFDRCVQFKNNSRIKIHDAKNHDDVTKELLDNDLENYMKASESKKRKRITYNEELENISESNFYDAFNSEITTQDCIFGCENGHSFQVECLRIENLSKNTLKRSLKSSNACYKCFEKSCEFSKCKAKNCAKCNENHHYKFCRPKSEVDDFESGNYDPAQWAKNRKKYPI